MADSSEGSARLRVGPDRTRTHGRAETLAHASHVARQSERVRLIPVTRTAAKFPAALPGMPDGKEAQVLAAVPDGCRVDRQGRRWLRHCRSTPAYTALRRDYRARVDAMLEFFAVGRQFDYGVLRPGLVQLQQIVPDVCERTLYRILDTLVQARWISRVQRGSTERYRGVPDGLGALACEFVLIIPIALITVRPRRSSTRNRKDSLRTRARPSYPQDRTHHATSPNPNHFKEPLRGTHWSGPAFAGQKRPEEGPTRPRRSWPARQVAGTRTDRLRAVQALQAELPDLRRISDRGLRSLLRPWYQAGWTNYDLHHALDHTPGGAEHRFGGDGHRIRYLPGWIRSRLALWQHIDPATGDLTDQPGLTPTQRRVTAAQAERNAAQAAFAAAVPARDQPAASTETRRTALAAIRELLAANKTRRDPPPL